MSRSKLALPALLAALVAFAPRAVTAEEAPFGRRVDIRMTMTAPDMVETVEIDDVVLRSPEAVRTLGQVKLAVNENAVDMTIRAAYTLKPDGRRVPVSKDKIIVSSEADPAVDGTFRADVKGRTIVFPELAPGDTIHYETVWKPRGRNIFPGISRSFLAMPTRRYEAFTVSLNAPKSVTVNSLAEGFTPATEESGDRRMTRWTLTAPPAYELDEAGAIAPFGRSPRLVFSTIKTWHDIGNFLYSNAEAKWRPTPKVKALAEEITKGKVGRKAQAEAIFRWVQQSVRYYNIVLGNGGWIPHDADSIISNRFGDCKDHATLTKALLAAKGIESDYVLTNLSAVYLRYDVIAPQWIDHAILYVPEFDRFIDPTSASTDFWSTAPAEAGKYAVRVRKDTSDLVRIPIDKAASNRFDIVADVTLQPDGTAVGTNTLRGRGHAAYALRAALARAETTGSELAVESALTSAGWRGGKGRVESRAELETEPGYEVKTSFSVETGLHHSAASVVPFGPRFITSAMNLIDGYGARRLKQPIPCWAETQSIVIDLHLPDGMEVANLPSDKTIETEQVSYVARYRPSKGLLHVERTLTLNLPDVVCGRDTVEALKPAFGDAMRDLGYRPLLRKTG